MLKSPAVRMDVVKDLSLAETQKEVLRLHLDIVKLLRLIDFSYRKIGRYLEAIWGPDPNAPQLTPDEESKIHEVLNLLRQWGHETVARQLQEAMLPQNEQYLTLKPDHGDTSLVTEVSQTIVGMRKSADDIIDRASLFCWFAIAYVDLPPEHKGIGYAKYSCHRAVFDRLTFLLSKVNKLVSSGRPTSQSSAPPSAPFDRASASSFHRYAINAFAALKLEMEGAIKCSGASMKQAMEHLNGLGGSIPREAAKHQPSTTAQVDQRDDDGNDWLYELWQAGYSWSKIRAEFQSVFAQRGWSKVSSENGIRSRVERYAIQHRLPLRRGKGGRPRKGKPVTEVNGVTDS